MLALITAALEGLASIPKILNLLINLNIDGRLKTLEEKHAKMDAAFKLATEAKTTEEKLNAADALTDAWNGN